MAIGFASLNLTIAQGHVPFELKHFSVKKYYNEHTDYSSIRINTAQTNKLKNEIMFKDNPLTQRKQQVKAMVARMAEAYNVEKKALPERLGTQKNVINNWGYYGRIPYEHLYHCHQVTGASMDWLLTGSTAKVSLTTEQREHLSQLVAESLTSCVSKQSKAPLCAKTMTQLCNCLSEKLGQTLESLLEQRQLLK